VQKRFAPDNSELSAEIGTRQTHQAIRLMMSTKATTAQQGAVESPSGHIWASDAAFLIKEVKQINALTVYSSCPTG